ncbi:MAG: type II secretion system minor pseudopilin GspK [Luminiphilus sp.]|jgi:general secretion pathway protein K
MSCQRSDLPGPQRGAALIVAMLVFALVAALLVGLQRDFSLTLQRGTQQLFAEQAWAYLLGAEGLAQLALQADNREDAMVDAPTDHLGELWAQPATPYPLDAGGEMRGQIEDLQGRFNLNLLLDAASPGGSGEAAGEDDPDKGDNEAEEGATPTAQNGTQTVSERWGPGQKVLIRLLQTLGEEALSLEEAMALTEAISDFIDRDSDKRKNGAEAEDYRYADFPYLPANQTLASVSELRAVRGMTSGLYEALRPWVTVWPETGAKINILTAPLPVLRSLNADDKWEPIPVNEVERLLAMRAEGEITSVEDLLSDPSFEGQAVTELQTLLGVRSRWFLLDASVELVSRERHLFSVLHRTAAGAVSAVFRSEGEL